MKNLLKCETIQAAYLNGLFHFIEIFGMEIFLKRHSDNYRNRLYIHCDKRLDISECMTYNELNEQGSDTNNEKPSKM